jgi:hypothetical protein
MSLANTIAKSVRTKIERFDKLYRILYRDYLYEDFIHQKDVHRMMDELHTRINELQAKVNEQVAAAITGANAAIAAHTHTVITAGSPGSHTGSTNSTANVAPVPAPTPVAITQIPWAEPTHAQKLATLVSQGPATAPFADSFDIQAADANINILVDIGV